MEIGRSRARDYDIFKQSFVSSDHTLHQGLDKMNKIEPLVYWTFTVQTTLTLGCEQQKNKISKFKILNLFKYDIFKQSFVSSDHTLHQGLDKMNKIEPLVYWTFTVQTTLTLGCEEQKNNHKQEMLRKSGATNWKCYELQHS